MIVPQWLQSRYLTPLKQAQLKASGGSITPLDDSPTIDERVQQLFGMQPNMDRLNLLPRHDSKQGWIAPSILYQLARAAVAPGVAAQGGDVSPEDAVNFAGNLAGGALGASAVKPVQGAGVIGQTVFHGSPHVFDAFDISKIGTGEGVQAYGHGLYVAENPTVANTYRTAGAVAYANSRVQELANRAFDVAGGDKQKALAWLYKRAQELPEDQQALRQTYYDAMNNYDSVRTTGAFYHVDLPDEHIARMLDWDAPLSQQPESVRKALRNAGIIDNEDYPTFPVPSHLKDDGEVAALIRGLAGQSSGDRFPALSKIDARTADEAASKFLASLGIPGIKYFDGGSRAAGNGTRNFVVFDDKLLKILKRE